MADVIADLSSPDLPAAFDSNMAAFWLAYGRGPGRTAVVASDAAWFYTGVPHPLFNGVIPARIAADRAGELVDTMSGLIAEGGAPAFWWVPPAAPDLGPALEGLGLVPVGDAPAMMLDLATLPGTGGDVAGLTLRKVEGASDQALWARTAATGTGFPPEATTALETLEAELSDDGYRAQPRYLGFLGGRPVAASALVLEAGIAGVYAVATLPEARNRGIGRLMTVLPLIEARTRGYRIATLQASSMGLPIYEKLGFKKVGAYRLYLQEA